MEIEGAYWAPATLPRLELGLVLVLGCAYLAPATLPRLGLGLGSGLGLGLELAHLAPATAPSMEACFLLLSSPLPARKQEPPSENWIITGRSSFMPASSTATHVDVVVQLKAGIA